MAARVSFGKKRGISIRFDLLTRLIKDSYIHRPRSDPKPLKNSPKPGAVQLRSHHPSQLACARVDSDVRVPKNTSGRAGSPVLELTQMSG